MDRFIFYSLEGRTIAPNGQEVENCQVLGMACGNDWQEAKVLLLKENPWIAECGFSVSKIAYQKLVQAKDCR